MVMYEADERWNKVIFLQSKYINNKAKEIKGIINMKKGVLEYSLMSFRFLNQFTEPLQIRLIAVWFSTSSRQIMTDNYPSFLAYFRKNSDT